MENAVRCLGALAVAAAAFAIHALVLEEDRVSDQRGAKVFTVGFDSEAVDGRPLTKVVVPVDAPAKDRPLLIFLHGRGENDRSYLTETLFAALDRVGPRAPIVAFPEGGEASYWHDREQGEWASYVEDEVLPRVIRRFEIDPERVAIGGISMGGYGAYNIARLSPGRFCAVGGHSPALWLSESDSAPGAFDNADDFQRNNVIAAAEDEPSPYANTRLWLDVGDEDPFAPAIDELAAALDAGPDAKLNYKTRPGAHDNEYWDRHFYGYLRFYAEALHDCRQPDETPEDPIESEPPQRPGPVRPAP